MRRIYLDYNATTPVDPRVREVMLPFLAEEYGNPSSLHWAGSRARAALEDARESAARLLDCGPGELYFTSGGTEGSNMAIKGVVAEALRRRAAPVHVVTTAVEHSSVLKPFEFLESLGQVEVTRLPVDGRGGIDLDLLRSAFKDNTVLVSVMAVNNETGNIYPIDAVARLAAERGIVSHADAVQAAGKLPLSLAKLGVDLVNLSAHKFYGPKGAGLLYKRKGVVLPPLIHGGAQEGERRGGTQSLPGIVGLAEAMKRVHEDLEEETTRLKGLRDRLQNQLLERVPGTRVHGDLEHRVANTLNVGFEGIESETILIALDRAGIAVSSGSACASGAVEPSHVLMAMGFSPKQAKGAVRFSLGRGTSSHDIEYVLETVPGIVKNLRS